MNNELNLNIVLFIYLLGKKFLPNVEIVYKLNEV